MGRGSGGRGQLILLACKLNPGTQLVLSGVFISSFSGRQDFVPAVSGKQELPSRRGVGGELREAAADSFKGPTSSVNHLNINKLPDKGKHTRTCALSFAGRKMGFKCSRTCVQA